MTVQFITDIDQCDLDDRAKAALRVRVRIQILEAVEIDELVEFRQYMHGKVSMLIADLTRQFADSLDGGVLFDCHVETLAYAEPIDLLKHHEQQLHAMLSCGALKTTGESPTASQGF